MSYNRRLNVEVTGSSRGFEAALNRINSGLTRTATGTRGVTRDMSLWERQILAIGTTARYALAGSLVFGVVGAIQRLGQLEGSLGEIASLAGQIDAQGKFQSIGDNINQVGDTALLTANRVGLATEDVQSYMTRFFSSFDPPGGTAGRLRAMREFTNEMAMLQAMMGKEAGDPQQLAGGIAGMIRGVPGGQRDIGGQTRRIANIIALVTQRSPVITGTDIARDIGRLSAAQTAMGMTPEEIFSVYGLASMSGGSGAVIGRGVSQLLGSEILRPQTDVQQQAFQSIGLPTDPGALRNFKYKGRRGGIAVLTRMMEAVGGNATIANPAALGNESLEDNEAIGAAGIRGMNITTAANLFGRQESFRQFLNLLANGGPKALEDFIASINKAERTNLARQREDEAIRHRTLLRFDEARRNLGVVAVRGIQWPLEHLVANPTIGLSNLATRHRTGTQIAEGAGATLLALRTIQRLRGRGGRGLLGRISGGATLAAESALQTEAMPSVLAGAAVDGSRANPYWVIIHPTSWMVGSPGGTGGFSSPVGGRGGMGKGGRLARWTSKYGGPAAILTAAAVAGAEAGNFLGADNNNIPSWLNHPTNKDLSRLLGRGGAAPSSIERALAKPLGPMISPNGAMDVTMRLVDAQGKQIAVERQRGVPVKWWQANQFPTKQGKPGTRKGH